MSGPPKDYVEVNERIVEWRDKYPDGTLQADVVPCPVDGFVIVKAYAYRTPDDPRPGTGLAWEPVPGQTNFTRDSELMNAETSAWGRALIAVGAADAKRGIASANEVRNRSQAPVLVELGPLHQLIGEAKAAGLTGDYDATVAWAAESQANADAAARKLRNALDAASDSSDGADGEAVPSEDPPKPAGTVSPAVDGPSGEAGSAPVPPSPDTTPYDWKKDAAARGFGMATDVIPAIGQVWGDIHKMLDERSRRKWGSAPGNTAQVSALAEVCPVGVADALARWKADNEEVRRG